MRRQQARKQLEVQLRAPLDQVPEGLAAYGLDLADDGRSLVYTYDTRAERTGITTLLKDISAAGLVLRDVRTRQSSLEDIFVDLVSESA